MILLLLHFLHFFFGFKTPVAFAHFSTRMVLAAITTLFLTIFCGKKVIKKLYELKTGRSIRTEDCPVLAALHEKKKETPTMGGVLILFSMLISLLLWMDLTSSFTLLLFIATLWLGMVGGIDDYLKMKKKNSKGLRARTKFFLQILFALFFSLYLLFPPLTSLFKVGNAYSPPVAKEQVYKGGAIKEKSYDTQTFYGRYYLPFKKGPLFTLEGWQLIIGFCLILIVITGTSNGVNLTDGLDGLAAGSILFVASVLAVFAFLSNHIVVSRYLNIPYIEGSGEVAIYLCAMFGASLGFLWYNGYPAQVFMGDVGSLALGGGLGVCAVLIRREFLLALVGGIFVAEALSVILQVLSYRYRNKKRIFLCAPLHHHFEFKGWPETKVVLRFWIIGLLLALISLGSIKFQ